MERAGTGTPPTRSRKKSRIPAFHTVEEEAEFWDAHSTAEFEDEFEEVKNVRFVRGGPTKTITVRLDEETFAALRQQAQENGVAPSRLARLWLFQRVQNERLVRPAKASSKPHP